MRSRRGTLRVGPELLLARSRSEVAESELRGVVEGLGCCLAGTPRHIRGEEEPRIAAAQRKLKEEQDNYLVNGDWFSGEIPSCARRRRRSRTPSFSKPSAGVGWSTRPS